MNWETTIPVSYTHLNIIQVADLVLPDKGTRFEEYTTMELLSVAMLIVISTFALDFIHTDRSVFKIVDLDEAWPFLNVAQGKTLANKLVRAGRAMNAAVYFVTQNAAEAVYKRQIISKSRVCWMGGRIIWRCCSENKIWFMI